MFVDSRSTLHLWVPLMMLIHLGHADLEILDHSAVLFEHLLKASGRPGRNNCHKAKKAWPPKQFQHNG